MKRTLFLASFLGLFGCILYGQNSSSAAKGRSNSGTVITGGVQNTGVINNSNTPPKPSGPNAQVAVTPGPYGSMVDSSAPAWPLGPAFEENLNFWLNGIPQTGENGGEAIERPGSQILPQNDQSSAAVFHATNQSGQGFQTRAQSIAPSGVQGNMAPAKKVVVVPSPVHYDRAGRRVIDPGRREPVYHTGRAETLSQIGGKAMDEKPEQPENVERDQDEGPAGNDPAVRKTAIVNPRPAVRRIQGILTAAKGMLALEDDDEVLWYLPGLDRYIGFIDGLDAGEEVALDGYAPSGGLSRERYFQPIRLFIDETVYNLAAPPQETVFSAQAPGGKTTITRKIEHRSGGSQPSREKIRGNPPAPAHPVWQHNHKSPWAPPTSVFDFEMDYDSIWRDDPAKRERESRKIWY